MLLSTRISKICNNIQGLFNSNVFWPRLSTECLEKNPLTYFLWCLRESGYFQWVRVCGATLLCDGGGGFLTGLGMKLRHHLICRVHSPVSGEWRTENLRHLQMRIRIKEGWWREDARLWLEMEWTGRRWWRWGGRWSESCSLPGGSKISEQYHHQCIGHNDAVTGSLGGSLGSGSGSGSPWLYLSENIRNSWGISLAKCRNCLHQKSKSDRQHNFTEELYIIAVGWWWWVCSKLYSFTHCLLFNVGDGAVKPGRPPWS